MNTTETNCRSCGAGGFLPILSLGRTPLANALLRADQLGRPEPTFPLDLVFCPNCHLVQITETVPPEVLFREYLYRSSFSDTMVKHAEALAHGLIESRRLGPNSLVVEAASNDGYLLQHYVRRGVPVLGIEPSIAIARCAAAERNVPTLAEFFDAELAGRLAAEGRRADLIHAHNVLAHVADLNGFVAGFPALLKDDGVAVIEVPYLLDMVERCEFDTIYHEHLCYFSLSAISPLFARHGLKVIDVERVAIHGGSLRLTADRAGSPRRPTAAVAGLRESEAEWGVQNCDSYGRFARRVEALKGDLNGLLRSLKAEGKRLAAYGASAKGSTLLNYFEIGPDLLDYVVDRSTVKQGLYTPGARLPILPPSRLIEDQPDYVLLLTWNFADEILAQQADYRRTGGKFIVPIPEVAVV